MKVNKLNLLSGVALAATLIGSISMAQAAEWKYAMEEGLSDPQGMYALKFKEEIEKNSDNTINIYPVGSLGESTDAMEQTLAGLVQFIDQSPGYTGAMIPEAEAFLVPYLLPSSPKQVNYFFKNGKAVNEDFHKIYREHDLELLSVFPEGEMAVTTMKEFHSPEDLRGVKIRTMPSPLLLETYKAFGASPIAMGWSELIGALKTNMVDGQENPSIWIEAYGLDELTKVLTYTGHNHYVTAVMANAEFYDGLSGKDKKLIQDASTVALDYILKKAVDLDALGLGRIVRTNPGYKIVTLTKEERAPFKKNARKVEKVFVEKAGARGQQIIDQMKTDLAVAAKAVK